MSLRDQIKEYAENAPQVRGGGSFIQYGKLTCKVNVLIWQGKGQTPLKTPYKEGTEVDDEKQALEIEFNIGVKELNPALEFDEWTRRVLVKSSSDRIKTDWSEIVLPSLQQVFGNDWADVVIGKKTYYVECEQHESAVPPPAGKRDYGVPKFLQKFKDISACQAARDARFGSSDDFNPDELGIPKEVIQQATALLKSVKGDKDKLKEMLKSKPFGEYDEDAIIAELE